ncbi:prepilin-type N-terminal cleavage/methylation domain-containing protein [Ferdinandcohnia sp. SAFN-114]|uniref:prepilin-type N-terminal cleavage/methylation domain-containing protein n=1 Tax=Ferdinandcohnia sp. SAFN-114 TaxID=3387275 RepID=UPI003F7E5088
MFKKHLKNQKGLTLIELLAVIVILGIIAAIAIPAIGNVISNTKLDSVKADAMQVLEASSLAIASEGPPSDSQFDYSSAANGANDLEEYIDETQLTSYVVYVVDGVPKTMDFVVTVNDKKYTASGVTKSDLQLKDFFESTNTARTGTVTVSDVE